MVVNYPAHNSIFSLAPQQRDHEKSEVQRCSGWKREYDLRSQTCILLRSWTIYLHCCFNIWYTVWNLVRPTQRSTAKGCSTCKGAEDEKSIVRFCETLDDLGHLLQGKMVKTVAISFLPSHWQQRLGKHWMTRFLNCHSAISTKFNQHLDRQRANANDPAILNNFFHKVYHFSMYIDFQLILVTVDWKTCQKAQCTTRKHLQYGWQGLSTKCYQWLRTVPLGSIPGPNWTVVKLVVLVVNTPELSTRVRFDCKLRTHLNWAGCQRVAQWVQL